MLLNNHQIVIQSVDLAFEIFCGTKRENGGRAKFWDLIWNFVPQRGKKENWIPTFWFKRSNWNWMENYANSPASLQINDKNSTDFPSMQIRIEFKLKHEIIASFAVNWMMSRVSRKIVRLLSQLSRSSSHKKLESFVGKQRSEVKVYNEIKFCNHKWFANEKTNGKRWIEERCDRAEKSLMNRLH